MSTEHIPSDTEAAMLLLRDSAKKLPTRVPIILKNHLYTLVDDRYAIDYEVVTFLKLPYLILN